MRTVRVHSKIMSLLSGNKSEEVLIQYVLTTRKDGSYPVLIGFSRSEAAHDVKLTMGPGHFPGTSIWYTLLPCRVFVLGCIPATLIPPCSALIVLTYLP